MACEHGAWRGCLQLLLTFSMESSALGLSLCTTLGPQDTGKMPGGVGYTESLKLSLPLARDRPLKKSSEEKGFGPANRGYGQDLWFQTRGQQRAGGDMVSAMSWHWVWTGHCAKRGPLLGNRKNPLPARASLRKQASSRMRDLEQG